MQKANYKNTILLLLIISFAFASMASNNKVDKNMIREIDLNGLWKFAIIQYDGWEKSNFNDASWDKIEVPGNWESQGYNGYDGYGFYRKQVKITADQAKNQLFLNLGYIDDVDEVYFNGELIGSKGSFPPKFKAAFDAYRNYLIPKSLINKNGENSIAVKVFDLHGVGGIVKGDPGIFSKDYPLKTTINLEGLWKFSPQNHHDFSEREYNHSNWDDIMVPGFWETQGYKGLNGCVWYRKNFEVTDDFSEEKLVMLVGKIDDLDRVFLNGTWIGQTGDNKNIDRCGGAPDGHYYKSERAYVFPASLLKKGTNIIAIKVVDTHDYGGIYEGPIGIIEQSKFIDYWNKRSQKTRSHKDNWW